MNDRRSTSGQWDSCPPGELQKLATRLRWRRRDRSVAKAVGLTGALIAFLFVGGLAVQQFRGPLDGAHLYGDVSCREVQANIQQYVAGQLDPQLADRIRIHLEQCPECGPPFRRMMAEMKQEVSFSPVPASDPACSCGHCRQHSLKTDSRLPINEAEFALVAAQLPHRGRTSR